MNSGTCLWYRKHREEGDWWRAVTHVLCQKNVGFAASSSYLLELLQVCIKSADIAHPARETGLHLRWTRDIIQEFFLQAREVALDFIVLHRTITT